MGAKKNRTREEDTRWEVAPRARFVIAYYYQTPARQAISNPASPAPLGYQQGSGDKVFREAIKVTSHLLPSFLNLGESRELKARATRKRRCECEGREKKGELSYSSSPRGFTARTGVLTQLASLAISASNS